MCKPVIGLQAGSAVFPKQRYLGKVLIKELSWSSSWSKWLFMGRCSNKVLAGNGCSQTTHPTVKGITWEEVWVEDLNFLRIWARIPLLKWCCGIRQELSMPCTEGLTLIHWGGFHRKTSSTCSAKRYYGFKVNIFSWITTEVLETFFGLFQKVSLILKTQGFVIKPIWFVAVTKQALASTSPSLYFTRLWWLGEGWSFPLFCFSFLILKVLWEGGTAV